jgi:hypothetical protein
MTQQQQQQIPHNVVHKNYKQANLKGVFVNDTMLGTEEISIHNKNDD